jgi:hypothetical protein
MIMQTYDEAKFNRRTTRRRKHRNETDQRDECRRRPRRCCRRRRRRARPSTSATAPDCRRRRRAAPTHCAIDADCRSSAPRCCGRNHCRRCCCWRCPTVRCRRAATGATNRIGATFARLVAMPELHPNASEREHAYRQCVLFVLLGGGDMSSLVVVDESRCPSPRSLLLLLFRSVCI